MEINMDKFMSLFDRYSFEYGLRLNIDYRGITDWSVQIDQKKETLFSEQDVDLNRAIAKAYLFLTDWLMENNGGY